MTIAEMWITVQQAGQWHKDVKTAAFRSAMFFLHRNHMQFIYQNIWIEPANLVCLWQVEFLNRIQARRGYAVWTGSLVAFDSKWSGIAHRLKRP